MNTNAPPPTPETDAALVDHMPKDATEWSEHYLTLCIHSRKLERERDEAREHLALYREQCAAANKGAKINAHINHSLAAKLAEAKRERDEAREQIASCAINTNVRLFDLVRQMRAPLHEDDLITDEEYFWLCGGCEMANSPEGGSPSPRRLEDYDVLSEKLQAMREAIKEAISALQTSAFVMQNIFPAPVHLGPCGPESCCDTSCMEAVALAGMLERNNATIAKLQPFIKP